MQKNMLEYRLGTDGNVCHCFLLSHAMLKVLAVFAKLKFLAHFFEQVILRFSSLLLVLLFFSKAFPYYQPYLKSLLSKFSLDFSTVASEA